MARIVNRVNYDSFEDEKKELTIEEFRIILIDELLDFSDQTIETVKNPVNEEQKKTRHTFNEWMGFFRQWASF